MSRLRAVFMNADKTITDKALQDILFLCCMSEKHRETILKHQLQHPQGSPPSIPVTLDHPSGESEIPDLFLAQVKRAIASSNVHYKQAIIVWYMLHDAELYGRFMLEHEEGKFQNTFMKALKEINTHFITGHHGNGAPFRPGDNFNKRRTGPFITRVREMFAVL